MAIIVDKEAYFLECSRYAHPHPVKEKISYPVMPFPFLPMVTYS
jgi:hypothetical protein